MNEKDLKTSPKQRFFIILIAVLMLGSMIAGYALIVINGGKSSDSSTTGQISEAKLMEYEAAYDKKEAEFAEATKDDFAVFSKYRSEVKAFNEAAANGGGIQTRDLLDGSGRELAAGDTDYLAYYIGWCPDETVFDSVYDDAANPTKLVRILDPGMGLIEGWNLAVEGMKIGGVREMTISSELAYGDSREICGGLNKPLKFIVMAKEKGGSLQTLADELDLASMKLQYAQYGIDYDTMMVSE